MSSANQFGQLFRVTTFGESHGSALGCVIDGCPAGVLIDVAVVQAALDRRRPGQAAWMSARKESDKVEFLSGVLDGVSLGTPIAAIVRNTDARSGDYKAVDAALKKGETPRAGHADDQWREKFGVSDVRGGGRSSGRETVARVIAGSIAQSAAQKMVPDLRVIGFSSEIAGISLDAAEREEFYSQFFSMTQGASSKAVGAADGFPADSYPARIPSAAKASAVEKLLVKAVADGKSYGGVAEIAVLGVPRGLGQPVFHKLKSDLASAYFGVGATAGLEIGAGFNATAAEGTEFHSSTKPSALESPYGGTRGGISTGEPIISRIAFKPTATVMDLAKRGRHDPCIVPRAIPVLEAMTWLVLVDHLLWQRLDRI